MGNWYPEPPLISNILEILVFVCLLIVMVFAIFEYLNDHKPDIQRYFLPSSSKNKICFFMEPQSMDSGVSIPFDNLLSPPKCTLSVVIPMMNYGKKINKYLDTVCGYFESKKAINDDLTFQIIVVDNCSTDKSAQETLEYARNNSNVTLLQLQKQGDIGDIVAAGCAHAGGENIFVFMPNLRCPVTIFDDMEAKSREYGNTFILFGTLPVPASAKEVFETRLGRFVLWIHDFILRSFGISGFAPLKTHSMLISREAAIKLIPNISQHDINYENELVLLAGMFRVPIDVVDEVQIANSYHFNIASFIYLTFRLFVLFIKYGLEFKRKIIVRR